jgi:hypothetical protein
VSQLEGTVKFINEIELNAIHNRIDVKEPEQAEKCEHGNSKEYCGKCSYIRRQKPTAKAEVEKLEDELHDCILEMLAEESIYFGEDNSSVCHDIVKEVMDVLDNRKYRASAKPANPDPIEVVYTKWRHVTWVEREEFETEFTKALWQAIRTHMELKQSLGK